MKVLERQLKRRLHPQRVVNAYPHFDALSDHSYDYNCLLCGYHPTTLIMDLNKKVSFACNMSDMELPETYIVTMQISYTVTNSGKMWNFQ